MCIVSILQVEVRFHYRTEEPNIEGKGDELTLKVIPMPPADRARSLKFWACVSCMVIAAAGAQILGICHFFATGIDLKASRSQRLQFLSGAVCRNELVFLTDSLPDGVPTVLPPTQTYRVDEVHCNLRTGRMSKSSVDSSIRYVVSDGVTFWRLPSDNQVYDPFAYGGRPVRFSRGDQPYHLEEFIDGNWIETDQYLLVPAGYPAHSCQSVHFGTASIPIIRFVRNELIAEFNSQVAIASKSEYIEFAKKLRKDTWREQRQPPPGWQRVEFSSRAFPMWSRPSHLDNCALGVWIQNKEVWALGSNYSGRRLSDFAFHRGNETPAIRVTSPLKWSPNSDSTMSRFFGPDGSMAVVPDGVDRVFIVSIDPDDHRVHIMEWRNQKLCLVAQRGSPFVFQKFIALEPAVRYVVLLPAFLLLVIAGVIQRFERPRLFCSAQKQVSLASAVRRGLARSVDLAIPATLFLTAVILHPDVTGWLREVHSQWMEQIFPWFSPPSAASTRTPADLVKSLAEVYRELLSVPYVPEWATGALIIVIFQAVWQGRDGRTIGKSLLGLRTLRTSLRPCGVAGSLLREILLILDSMFFLSWIPGVVLIMSTNNSQRLGDRLADTIVVRDEDSMLVMNSKCD